MEMYMSIKFYLIIFLSFISIGNLLSQEIKFDEYELPTSNNLVEVEFFNRNNGIIVSDSAEIFYTTDSGRIWIKSDINLKFSPNSLVFTTNGEAVVIGSNKTIIKSYDYGQNWLVISHSDTSNVIYNYIVSRSPYEIYITQLDSKKIHYSIDGLSSIREIDLSTEGYKIKTYPIMYNKIDNKIYCSGNTYYDFKISNSYYYNQGIFRTQYFDTLFPTYHHTITYSPNSNININVKELAVINSEVVRFDGVSIRPLKGGSPDGPSDSYYNNAVSCRRIFVTNKNEVILPDDNGNITFLNNFNSKKSDTIKVKVSDTLLYDFALIKDKKMITTSTKGKYYIYDNKDEVKNIDTNLIVIKDTTKNEKFDLFDIYPNPTLDKSSILFDKLTFTLSIELFDLTGYNIYSAKPEKEILFHILDVNNFQSGTYFLKIITNNNTFYRKIVKF